MPGVEKKVRKLLPEPKPQPKEEVVLKSGIVFFNCFFLALRWPETDLKAYKMFLSLGQITYSDTYLSQFIYSCIEN